MWSSPLPTGSERWGYDGLGKKMGKYQKASNGRDTGSGLGLRRWKDFE